MSDFGFFKKKPVVIQAYHWTEENQVKQEQWPLWLYAAWQKNMEEPGALLMDGNGKWRIFTLEGLHTIDTGDWIIQGVKGELYPCKPDIFEATYDQVDGNERVVPV